MPKPEDFGLTESETVTPKLLSDMVKPGTASRVGVPLAVVAGVGVVIQLIGETGTIGKGLAFGLPLGFVTYLIFGFVFPVLFALAVNLISAIQRLALSGIDGRVRRAFEYKAALDAWNRHDRI
jgi:hypothetical protein